jgi:hypothetical protein
LGQFDQWLPSGRYHLWRQLNLSNQLGLSHQLRQLGLSHQLHQLDQPFPWRQLILWSQWGRLLLWSQWGRLHLWSPLVQDLPLLQQILLHPCYLLGL